MKTIKTFRITEANLKKLAFLSIHHDRSEGYIINKALEKYLWKDGKTLKGTKDSIK